MPLVFLQRKCSSCKKIMFFLNMLKTLRLWSRIGVRPLQETTKIEKNREQNRFKISVCNNSAAEDDFFDF